MPGLTYSAGFSAVTFTNANGDADIFELTSPADASVEIISCEVWQYSDFGDAAAEIIGFTIVRGAGSVTAGSGGTGATEEPMMFGYPAAGSTVVYYNTTRMAAGTGTLHTIGAGGWNVALGIFYQPTPEERCWLSPSQKWTIGILAGPADDLSVAGRLTWCEYGG